MEDIEPCVLLSLVHPSQAKELVDCLIIGSEVM
jgi:hypothetical protein